MTGVEDEHGADFSNGIPAAYSILGALLQSVIEGLAPDFELVEARGRRRLRGRAGNPARRSG